MTPQKTTTIWLANLNSAWQLPWTTAHDKMIRRFQVPYALYRTTGLTAGKSLVDWKDNELRFAMEVMTVKATSFWRFRSIKDAQDCLLGIGRLTLSGIRSDTYHIKRGAKIMGTVRKMEVDVNHCCNPTY